MLACYHADVVFSDPAFGELHGKKAHHMWEMLVSRLDEKAEISVKNIQYDEFKGSADWTAKYVYGRKKRLVVNHIHASFKFKEGKIIEHRDDFNLWRWSSQALGLPGYILGWTPFFKESLQKKTNQILTNHISETS